MSKMIVAFYKSNTGNILDKSIDMWSSFIAKLLYRIRDNIDGFSHVELIFSNGLSFSSSPRDGGTRFKWIEYDINQWEFLSIDSPYSEEEIYNAAVVLDDLEYDYLGLFLHEFLPLNIDNQKRWWCSEIICYLLGIKNYKISPNYLYYLSINKELKYKKVEYESN